MYNINLGVPSELRLIVRDAVEALQHIEFDTLVFRGFSGALVGPTVAHAMGKPFALIRKPGDSTHSDNSIEGHIEGQYLILDDFIDSGETINSMVNLYPLRCVGVYLYDFRWLAAMDEVQQEIYRSRIQTKIINWA